MIETGDISLQLDDLAFRIQSGLDEIIIADNEKKKPESHTNNWASEVDHPCERMLTYSRLHFDKRSEKEVDSLYRFKEGNDQEDLIEASIKRAGFKIIKTQTRFEWTKFKLSGKIDGKIQDGRNFYTIEIKTVSPHYWDSTSTIEDIRNHPKFWIRKIVSQINLYLIMEGEKVGIIILKTFGKRPRFLPWFLDLDLAEKNLKTCERVNAAVESETLPDRIPYESDVCGLCDFEGLCQPIKPSLVSEIREADVPDLNRYLDLRPQKSEYDKLRKRFIGTKADPGIYYGADCIYGDIEISSKFGKRKSGSGYVDSVTTTIERIS